MAHARALLADVVSTLTVAACLLQKVPQIMSLRTSSSAHGLNVHALLVETVSYTLATLYNVTHDRAPLTYLEYPLLVVQQLLTLYYVQAARNRLADYDTLLVGSLYVLYVVLFLTEILSKQILACLLPLCTPLSGFAKVSYMYGIIRARNADAVSLTTWLISVFTNAARIFTVYVDSGDVTLMINFCVSAALSGGVLLTAAYYQSVRPPVTSRPKPRCRSH